MKKIGKATILIVADVISYVTFSIRSLFHEEQSSLKKNYLLNSVFCSHAMFEYPPLAQRINYCIAKNDIKMHIA